MESRAMQRGVRQSARKMRLVIDLIRGRAVPEAADALRVSYAVVNEGQTLKRFTAAAMGRGTPILKRTSHVEIRVAGAAAPLAPPPAASKPDVKEAKKPRAAAKKTTATKAKKKAPRAAKKKKASK